MPWLPWSLTRQRQRLFCVLPFVIVAGVFLCDVATNGLFHLSALQPIAVLAASRWGCPHIARWTTLAASLLCVTSIFVTAGPLLPALVQGIVSVLVLCATLTLVHPQSRLSIPSPGSARLGAEPGASVPLSAALVHELRQPLAVVLTDSRACLRWLGKAEPDISEARTCANRISQNARRANNILSALATFHKGSLEAVSLDALITRTLREFQDEIVGYRIQVEVDLISAAMVKGNPVQLQLIIKNLVANAIQALATVQDRSRILSIRMLDRDKETIVEVRDNGPGIAVEDEEIIFSAFHTTKLGGMGIGLPISRNFARDHGGDLHFIPSDRLGAIFRVELPAPGKRPHESGGRFSSSL
ncbi:sensor histidine kinase [Bradyrhizobium diazoefficiens]